MLSRSGGNRHPRLILYLTGNKFCTSSLSMTIAIDFYKWPLRVEKIPFCSNFGESFVFFFNQKSIFFCLYLLR